MIGNLEKTWLISSQYISNVLFTTNLVVGKNVMTYTLLSNITAAKIYSLSSRLRIYIINVFLVIALSVRTPIYVTSKIILKTTIN